MPYVKRVRDRLLGGIVCTCTEHDDGTFSLDVGGRQAVTPDGATSVRVPPGHRILVTFTQAGPVMRAVPKEGSR